MWRFTQAILTLFAVSAFAAWWWWPTPPPEAPVPPEPEEPVPPAALPVPTPAAVQFVDVWDGAPLVGVEVGWRAAVEGGDATSRRSRTTAGGRLRLRDLAPGTTLAIEDLADPWALIPRQPHEPPLERFAVRLVDVELVLRNDADGDAVEFGSAALELGDWDERPGSGEWYGTLVALESDGPGRAVGRLPRVPGASLRISATNGGSVALRVDPSVGTWSDDGSVWTVECEVR